MAICLPRPPKDYNKKQTKARTLAVKPHPLETELKIAYPSIATAKELDDE